MKQWRETALVLDEWARLRARGQSAALATVVRVRGSAYRRPGAKLLVAEDGSTVGNVSGGCLEQDVREVALGVIRSGVAELQSYCSGADPVEAWDLGVGCEGEVEVYVQPLSGPFDHVRQALADDRPFALCSVCEPGGSGATGMLVVAEGGEVAGNLGDAGLEALALGAVRSAVEDGEAGLTTVGGRTLFVEPFQPPPALVVFGAGDDARPLVDLAVQVGFRVTVVDRRPAMLAAGRFTPEASRLVARPGEVSARMGRPRECYAVLMTHSFADDAGYLREVAEWPLRYLGMLGPRARTERLLTSTGLEALAESPLLYAPVGLDVGTEGAEQVAVSVLAELLAARSGRPGLPLRARCAPIHAGAG